MNQEVDCDQEQGFTGAEPIGHLLNIDGKVLASFPEGSTEVILVLQCPQQPRNLVSVLLHATADNTKLQLTEFSPGDDLIQCITSAHEITAHKVSKREDDIAALSQAVKIQQLVVERTEGKQGGEDMINLCAMIGKHKKRIQELEAMPIIYKKWRGLSITLLPGRLVHADRFPQPIIYCTAEHKFGERISWEKSEMVEVHKEVLFRGTGIDESWRSTLDIGSKCDVWDTRSKCVRWYVSTVLQISPDSSQILIHFEGWESHWDKWFPRDSPYIAPLGFKNGVNFVTTKLPTRLAQ